MPEPVLRHGRPPKGRLEEYFDGNTAGPGIWKWRHYFPMYERHLAKFVGTSPVVVEVGVYSGGSLGMWKAYFGDGARIVGMDIEPACRAYERPGVEIAIGDQSDRGFWRAFRDAHPRVDVLIDDGSHVHEHQVVTLEEMLAHLAPGGVYICEDVHGVRNPFATHVSRLVAAANDIEPTPFRRHVASVTWYPFAVVIEKREHAVEPLTADRRGTEWQPFFDAANRPVADQSAARASPPPA